MNYCEVCGTPLLKDSIYCPTCGTYLKQIENFELKEEKSKFCEQCGAPTPKTYCPYKCQY